MFGYIRPYKPEMLVKEYELYKSVYCGLCRQLCKDYGAFASLILNYDCTFLAMFCAGTNANSAAPVITQKCCTCNPLKRCNYCSTNDNSLEIAAAFCVISFYYKLHDTISDEGFAKAASARAFKPTAKIWKNKASKKYPELDETVSSMLKKQAETEKLENCSVDRAADPTAQMLSRLMMTFAENKNEERVYSRLGYYLGRWIYLIDAADDFDKDRENGSFNPIVNKFSNQKELDSSNNKFKSYCNGLLNQTMAQIVAAYNLTEIKIFGSIIDHIINIGMPEMQRQIIFERNCNKKILKSEVYDYDRSI